MKQNDENTDIDDGYPIGDADGGATKKDIYGGEAVAHHQREESISQRYVLGIRHAGISGKRDPA